MKIGVFTDSHYCTLKFDDDRNPELTAGKIKSMLDDYKNNGIDRIFCLGDLLHFESDAKQNLNNLEYIADLINSYNIPLTLIPGNHDCEIFTKEEYAKISGFDIAPVCYETENSKLVLIDACCDDDGTPHLPPENDWTNSYVPLSQLEWLKKELSSTSKNCYVFTHQCLDYCVECHHIIRNAVVINSIIYDAGNVKHVYSGHYHPGKEGVINSIDYTTLKAMVLGEENSYIIIEI